MLLINSPRPAVFEQVFQYRIPVLHPLLVHFPIALTFVALVCAGLWLVLDRRHWLMSAALLQSVAWVFTWAAFLTGDALHEQSEGVTIVDQLVEYHESMAEWALWVTGISAFLLWMMLRVSSRDTRRAGSARWMRIAGFLVTLAACALIVWVSHIGGVMVWGTPV